VDETGEIGKGFLGRWSERKLRTREAEETGVRPAPDPHPPAPETGEPGEAPLLTDADMPPLESLDGSSDYSGFLSPGVSEALRRKALSQLFHSPRLNLVDGLDDYAEDFAGFVPLGDIVTADMRHRMEQAARRLLCGEEESVVAADALAAEPAADGGGDEAAGGLGDPDPDRDDAEAQT
jgi:hypothetical protein